MPTAVPSPSFGPSGAVIPATLDVYNGVLTDLNTAFGGTLNITTPTTPQAQLASSLTAYITDKNALFAYMAAQTDPATAQGFMQDAIGALFGLTRFPATATSVSCTCRGSVGTVIPAGAQAQDTAGNLYICFLGGTIGAGGTITLQFLDLQTGPIACPAGTLTRIMTTTPGWDSITNPTGTDTTPSTLGLNLEAPQAFEARRQQSLFVNASSPAQSIEAAVLASGAALLPADVPVDCFVVDNATNAPVTTSGILLPANSVYIAVEGGDPASIATAIWQKKGLGCSYAPSAQFTASTASSTSLTVTAMTSGTIQVGQAVICAGVLAGTTILSQTSGTTGGAGVYVLSAAASATASGLAASSANYRLVSDTRYFTPAPTYAVYYTVPLQLSLALTVVLVNSSAVPIGYYSLLYTALSSAFLGGDGGPQARIGATVFGARFLATVQATLPGVLVSSVTVGGVTTFGLTASCSGSTLTVTVVGGVLAPGQVITGAGIPSGTTISAYGTGSGGVGTYTLSTTPGTVASEAMTVTVAAPGAGPSVTARADQYPVFSALSVSLI